jgi:branched-chain amino acid transport system permease protein
MLPSRLAFWIAATLVVLALPFVLGEGYQLHLLIMATIFAIVTAGLDITVGYAGLLSLGHAAFFGIGAYTSALMFLHFGIPMWGGMIGGAALAGLAAYLLGFLILNVRGHRFVICTVAFAEIMRLIANNWTDLTRGQRGLPGILPPVIDLPWGGSINFVSKTAFFYLAVAIAVICISIMWRIAHSPLGGAFIAMRENEHLAESVGIDARRHAILAFTIGGFFAGIGGSLYAHYVSFVGPDLFSFSYTTIFLVMVVTGGMGTIIGPVIGALVFTLLPEYLRIAEGYRLIIFGGTLVLVMLFLPHGMIEIWTRLRNWQRAMRLSARAQSTDA